jgi:hypothetical protein
MSDSNNFLAIAKTIDRSPDNTTVTIRFDNGETARLDTRDPRSETYLAVLDELRSLTYLAYVELSPENGAITRLLVPLQVKVINITQSEFGDVSLCFENSQARHILKKTHPQFERLLDRLRTARDHSATVMVTDAENGHEIIDVSTATNPQSPVVKAPTRTSPADQNLAPSTVSQGEAKELFDCVAQRKCKPISDSVSCIPFSYPEDGCWARAHEMCRLMISENVQPGKMWIYAKGVLIVKTPNSPTCLVAWCWHVAPTLQVDSGEGFELQIVDPAIFPGPVPVAEWKCAQQDPGAALVPTDSSVFLRTPDGRIQTDPTYVKTALALALFRLKLILRSIGKDGPPPYKCQ